MLNIMNHYEYCVKKKNDLLASLESLESAQVMTRKDDHIGFRVASEVKAALSQIARKEERSLAQICEIFLRGAINEYEKEGSSYLHRLLIRPKEKGR